MTSAGRRQMERSSGDGANSNQLANGFMGLRNILRPTGQVRNRRIGRINAEIVIKRGCLIVVLHWC